MEELSDEQIEEFKEAFSLFDPEGHGYIQAKELGTVLRSLGIHTTDEEKNEFVEKYDPNSESIIYFKDFIEILITKISETKPDEELTEAFNLFDVDKRYYLELESFKNDLLTYAPGIDSHEINDILEFLKSDQNVIKIDDAVQKLYSKIQPHLN